MSRSGALAYGRSGSRCAPRSRRIAVEPRVTHLGLHAFPRSGLDRSLDRRHLTIAYALNSALENAAGDRAHDAREVDLNPHLGVGPPIVRRLEFHSPARRGSTHWPGERHVAGRLDSGHLLAPAASQPEYALRPLFHPRAGLKRSSSANPAFENRWRPLRPASDITDIRPRLTDAAGDCYMALGSDCDRADFVLITFRLRKVSATLHPDRDACKCAPMAGGSGKSRRPSSAGRSQREP